MPPLRPHWFRGKDALFPGALVPLTLAPLLWSRTTGAEERLGVLLALALQAGLAVSVLGAVGIYAATLWRRRALLRGFTYIRGPFYAVMINSGSYAGALEPELVIGQFYRAFESWQRAFGWSQVRDFAGGALFWVWLRPNLVGSCGHGDKMSLPGFSVSRAHKIVVSYRRSNEPLAQTTFQHELGHVIQGGITGSWSVDAHHDRASSFLIDSPPPRA